MKFNHQVFPAKKYSFIALSLACVLITFEVPVQAQVTISDTLNGFLEDTTYLVIGDIQVIPGDTLTIEAGAVFLFDGLYSIDVNGYLYANGTADDSIYFLPGNEEIEWESIYYRQNLDVGGELNYCYLTGCSSGAVNIFMGTDVKISNSTITGNHANWGGGIYIRYSEPLITDCLVSDNWSVNNGGGIYISHASPIITNCIVTGNLSDNGGGGSGQGGGGICANHYSHPIITDCIIYDNTTYGKGGGVVINDVSDAVVQRCQIYDNYSEVTGGGVFISYAEPLIKNCTINHNTSNLTGGGITVELDATPLIQNCIISNNLGEGGVYISRSQYLTMEYSDIFGNAMAGITGDTLPEFIGELSQVNANGDSCDIYHNIFIDAEFADPFNFDFTLAAGSPCIDAGDPDGTPDPDGTVADLGALFSAQGTFLIYDLTIKIQNEAVVLNWLPVNGAAVYNIYRSDDPYFDHLLLQPYAITDDVIFIDDDALNNQAMYYKITWE